METLNDVLERAKLHKNLPVYRKRVKKAMLYIAEFLTECKKPYVALSAGKDSSVIAHMSNKLCPEIKMASVINDDLDFPENRETLQKLKEQFNFNIEILKPDVSGWEILKNETNDIFNQINNAASKLDKKCFYEPLDKFVKRGGYDGVIMGLRAEESQARLNNLKFNGAIYRKKNRLLVCNPISHFKAIDVFAYLCQYNIPISPIYNKTALGTPPGRLREGWWPPGESTSKHGYCVWLKYYYPDLFTKLVSEFPETKQYI